MSVLTEKQQQALTEAARQASRHSYAPYSKFPVGAAVLTDSGRIVAGCNVENASLGLTCCAERVALFNAVSLGEQRFVAIAVYTPTAAPTAPCGACRQALREFASDLAVIAVCDGEERLDAPLSSLLPAPFAPPDDKDDPHEP